MMLHTCCVLMSFILHPHRFSSIHSFLGWPDHPKWWIRIHQGHSNMNIDVQLEHCSLSVSVCLSTLSFASTSLVCQACSERYQRYGAWNPRFLQLSNKHQKATWHKNITAKSGGVFPQTVCPHWGVLMVGVKAGAWSGGSICSAAFFL